MLMLRQVDTEQLTAPPCGQKEKEQEEMRQRDRGVYENKHCNGRRQWDCRRFEPKQVTAAWRDGLDEESLHSHGRAGRAGDRLPGYLSGIAQADVRVTTGSRVVVINQPYIQQPWASYHPPPPV